jgi:hypothetical protein
VSDTETDFEFGIGLEGKLSPTTTARIEYRTGLSFRSETEERADLWPNARPAIAVRMIGVDRTAALCTLTSQYQLEVSELREP